MKIKKWAAASVAAVAISVGMGAPAGADLSTKAQAQVIGTVVTHDDGTASVTARYVCPEGFHLWVSAKQSADGQPDQALRGEGSSQVSAAWLQSHPDPSTFTCDGTWHVGTYTIDIAEQGFGELVDGQAWVQFCLVGEQAFISASRWVAVT